MKNSVSQIENWVAGLLSAIVPFVVYALSLAPDVVIEGDSGEIITGIYEFGIIHSPGFPGYVVFAKLFTVLLSWIDIAKSTNLFSAFCGSLCCFWIFKIGRYLDLRWTAVALGLTLAASSEFWYGSSAAEVYTLALLTLLWIVDAALRFEIDSRKSAIWLGVAIGFGISVHVYSWAYSPIVAAILIREFKGNPKLFKQIRIAFLGMVAGLFPYLYIPLRAGKGNFINEGGIDSFARFLEHATWIVQRQRVDEASSMAIVKFIGIKIQQLGYFAQELRLQWGLAGLAILLGLAFIGFRFFLNKNSGATTRERRFFWLAGSGLVALPLVVWLVFAGDSFEPGLMAEMAVHMLTAYVFLCLFGFSAIFALAKKEKLPVSEYDARPAAILMLVPIFLLIMRLGEYSLGTNKIAVAHATDLLEHLPPKAILMGDNDNDLMPTTYLKSVRRVREDVALLNLMNGTEWNYDNYRRLYPHLKWPGYARTYYSPLVTLNVNEHPIYFTSPFGVTAFLRVSGLQSKYEFVPIHGGFRLVPKGEKIVDAVIADRKALAAKGGFMMATVDTKLHLRDREMDVIASRSDYLLHQARYLASQGQTDEARKAVGEALGIPTLGRTEYGRALIEEAQKLRLY